MVNVINALPTSKLISTVSNAIGKAYEPRHKRKMADAAAYEIRAVSEALRENCDIIASYNEGRVVETLPDFEEFKKRTLQRLGYQELIKQKNIEAVVDIAYDQLEKESEISQEPVSNDWTSRFFNCVETISDEQMQQLWGSILSGEIKKPGSFSFRTLETIKNMSQSEAKVFEKVSSMLLWTGNDCFLSSNTDILGKHSISYSDILVLGECGLLVEDGLISDELKLNKEEQHCIISKDLLVNIEGGKQDSIILSFGIHPLTQAGRELCGIVQKQSEEQFVMDFAEDLFNNNSGKCTIGVHRITMIDGDKYHYEPNAIKKWSRD